MKPCIHSQAQARGVSGWSSEGGGLVWALSQSMPGVGFPGSKWADYGHHQICHHPGSESAACALRNHLLPASNCSLLWQPWLHVGITWGVFDLVPPRWGPDGTKAPPSYSPVQPGLRPAELSKPPAARMWTKGSGTVEWDSAVKNTGCPWGSDPGLSFSICTMGDD